MDLSAIRSDTLLGQMLRAPLRLISPDAKLRILSGPAFGKKWIAGSGDHGCWLGTYEIAKQREIVKALKPGQVVYDIGANVGFYSLISSVLVGPAGHVYCFEPAEEPLSFLRFHIEANHARNCTILETALANTDGIAYFQNGPSNSTGKLTAAGACPVTVARMDTLVEKAEILPPHVIKCDIEGAEYEALLGAARTIANHKPLIFLATHGAAVHRNCCDYLRAAGYTLRALDGKPLEASSEIAASFSS